MAPSIDLSLVISWTFPWLSLLSFSPVRRWGVVLCRSVCLAAVQELLFVYLKNWANTVLLQLIVLSTAGAGEYYKRERYLVRTIYCFTFEFRYYCKMMTKWWCWVKGWYLILHRRWYSHFIKSLSLYSKGWVSRLSAPAAII